MAHYEYMRIPMDLIPDEDVKQYNLQELAVNGWAYLEICKGISGLKQARKHANERLKITCANTDTPPVLALPHFGPTSPCPSLLHLSLMILV